MILKGNIRANGAELARHLLNERQDIDPDDSRQPPKLGNERVEVAELRGFAARDLAGAFDEIEAIAAGTKSTKPLYSLSINPSQPMSREEYGRAVDRIEEKLGLTDQARAVVFHVKEGREHCHVVWSRIDHEKMQARHMEFDRQKLREVARELVREMGHEMPKFLGEDRGTDRFKDRFKEVTLAEQGQARRTGLDPAERKQAITEAYQRSDNGEAFRAALGEHGFMLAQGDKRGLVVVDRGGEVHSLNRQIDGAKAKEIREKLQIDGMARDLPTVQQAKELIAEKAREKATERPQERDNPAERVEHAEKALEAVREAENAELKALRGGYREQLKHIREAEAERMTEAKTAIKDAYRPEWRDLFKRQREEMEALKHETATPARRLKALLSGRAGDAFDFANRGTLAGAFNFVVRGHMDTAKLEKAHTAEKRDLGDMQKLAEREEIRAIRQEVREQRAEAREQHKDAYSVTRESYAEQREEAARLLEQSRKLIEEQGRDVSRGEKAEREGRSGFGFSRQGFGERKGFGFGRGREREDEDERERPFKPPSQSFTP
ncbi:relaxase/mobilization nuclease domain-containing protein (plasmid) [Paracoccus sp. T5]